MGDATNKMDEIPLKDVSAPKMARCSPLSPAPVSELLKLVRENDIAGIRLMFKDSEIDPTNPENCDELGRSAFIIAIDMNHLDLIKCLLEIKLDPGDALFHAVETHNAKAVQTICRNLPETKKVEVLNRCPVSQHWTRTCKPLMLAARQGNAETVQTLLQHGAEIPAFNELLPRVTDDSYGHFLALFHWYEAVSSEAYIMLTSEDPLETIFQLGRSLEKLENRIRMRRFKQGCDGILANLEALSTKLLSLARDNKEVELLLNGGDSESAGKPMLPRRIRQALDIGFKKFVSHPSCQDYMVSKWELSPRHVRGYARSRLTAALGDIFLIVFFFVPCILYILLPVEKLRATKRPFVRFMLHLASKLCFLLILVILTITPHVVVIDRSQDGQRNLTAAEQVSRYLHYKARPWDFFTVVIVLWIIGMTFRSAKEMWTRGVKRFVRNNIWNIVDCFQLLLYWIFIIMTAVAYFKALKETKQPGFFQAAPTDAPISSSTTMAPQIPLVLAGFIGAVIPDENKGNNIYGNYGNESRYDWFMFDPVLIAEAAFAVANVLTYLHLLHSLLILGFLGPLLISFGGMTADVAKFFVIFIFVWISFALGLTQLYRTFEALDLQSCLSNAGEECRPTPFLMVWFSIKTLFWSLFDLMDQDGLSIHGNLGFTETIGTMLYATYMFVGSLVLLNALIAMMSNTYTRVEENSEVEWKVVRTRLMGEYMMPCATLPPPFNLVPTVKSIIRLVRCVGRKCFKAEGAVNEPKQESTTLSSYGDTYKELSRGIAERCRRAMQIAKLTKTQENRGKQEVAELKKAVDLMRRDMKELQLQIQKLVPQS